MDENTCICTTHEHSGEGKCQREFCRCESKGKNYMYSFQLDIPAREITSWPYRAYAVSTADLFYLLRYLTESFRVDADFIEITPLSS